MKKPVIAISSGDPAGIGPEITVKALAEPEVYAACRPLVAADASIIRMAVDLCRLPLNVNAIKDPCEAKYRYGIIDVLDHQNVNLKKFTRGMVTAAGGQAAYDYIRTVIGLAMHKKADATVTGPINKEALKMAGIEFAGHTEIFAHFTGVSNYAMMLAEKDFRVVHVNTHVSMLESIRRISRQKVLDTIILAHQALKNMGMENPRIAVNGLNPHAGENGLFGTEEIEHIIPAIRDARNLGINADGPHPPDTIFPKMAGKLYDVVICMYHDQGHIPTKLLGFRYDEKSGRWENMSGVNITLGLPIIRVSVDHGTAFDIAGQNKANPESMIQAIMYAVKFSLRN